MTCSNFSGTRVRIDGTSNETVTALSTRNALMPSASGDAPAGITGEIGAPGRTATAAGVAAVESTFATVGDVTIGAGLIERDDESLRTGTVAFEGSG
jgi:hypothetical protein